MSLRRFFQILSDLKWLIAGVFLYGLSQQGDYLLLGGMVSAQVLGYYFFGFQLTASVGLLIGMAIGGTLLPVLAKFAGDRAAIHESYLRFGAPMLAISCLLSLGLVGFGPTLIQLIWNGKWDASAYTAAVLAISLPMRILVSASSAAMEAMGLWRTQTLLLIVDAVGLIVAAAVGATLGGLDMIATSVSIQRCLQGLIAAGVAFRAAGASTGSLAEFIGRTLVPFVALSIVLLLLQSLSPSADKLVAVVRGLAMTGAATVIWVFFLWRFDCATLVGLVGLLSRRRSSAGQ